MSSIFLTSLNGFKFHMQVSDPDSIKFFKFHELWRTLSKCENFIHFLRSCADGIFCHFSNSLYDLKFHIHVPVSDADSNKFYLFDEIGELIEN